MPTLFHIVLRTTALRYCFYPDCKSKLRSAVTFQALQLVNGSSPGVSGFRAQAWVQKVLSTSAYRWLWHPWLYYLDHHGLTLWASFPSLSERGPSCWPTDFRPISCISIKHVLMKMFGGKRALYQHAWCYLRLSNQSGWSIISRCVSIPGGFHLT